jgi:hypothetical protein
MIKGRKLQWKTGRKKDTFKDKSKKLRSNATKSRLGGDKKGPSVNNLHGGKFSEGARM